MCGIAGLYGFNDREASNIVRAMIDSMRHRGPDDEGIWGEGGNGICMGSCRLAILDLSPAAHMPMSSKDGKFCITYNGEIYNFHEIRGELSKKNHNFISNSDTEVILHAYMEWGVECLEKFRGMFAFAIWDGVRNSLFLARDRFGIKNIYWTMTSRGLLFASELKAILASGMVPRKINIQAMWDYLSIGAVPQGKTMVEGIKTLLPGHAMLIEKEKIDIWRYWDLDEIAKKLDVPDDLVVATEMLRGLLEEAIKQHMIADVKVGAFLSGGIDSSTIVALMSKYVKYPLHTYSIGFEEEDNGLNELLFAERVAKQYGTIHNQYILRGEEVASQLECIFSAIDQPSIDGINTYFVSRAASSDVKVVLSGLGGDELFAGYPHFKRFLIADKYAPFGNRWLAHLSNILPEWFPGRVRLPLGFYGGNLINRHASIRILFSEEEKKEIIRGEINNEEANLRPITDFYSPLVGRGKDVAEEVSYVEANGYMTNMLLRDSDVMSMVHSLELRVPFLDHKLAEFAYALPAVFKTGNGVDKLILKDSVRDILPPEIIYRKKAGFDLPIRRWLEGALRDQALELLEQERVKALFSGTGLCRVKSYLDKGQFLKTWSIIILSGWMDQMKVSL